MAHSGSILRRVKATGLIKPKDYIIAGVSGGVDSVVLLDILHKLSLELGFKLAVAHVNYNLRGRESVRDEKFVNGLAKGYGLKIFCARPKGIKKPKENLQSTARDFRYDFFIKKAASVGANKIAVAHHTSDQAETVLLNFIRGTGPSGLTGMQSVRPLSKDIDLIRPLLKFLKEELFAYTKENNLKFVEDSSNKKKGYRRNIIRLKILKDLELYNPNIISHISKTAELLRSEGEALESAASLLFKQICRRRANVISFTRGKFMAQPTALQRRVLRLAYSNIAQGTKDLLTDHVEQMLHIIQSTNKNGTYYLPKNCRFIRKLDKISLKSHI